MEEKLFITLNLNDFKEQMEELKTMDNELKSEVLQDIVSLLKCFGISMVYLKEKNNGIDYEYLD